MAIAATSSITVFSPRLPNNLREVIKMKQMPTRLEDAFNICGDF